VLELALDLPAAHAQVVVARKALRVFARMQGLEAGDVDPIQLVASELLANAVDHGGGDAALDASGGELRMRLEFRIEPEAWTLVVADAGDGDPEKLSAQFAEGGIPDLEDERGRGLFLMRELVDRIDVSAGLGGRGVRVEVRRQHGGSCRLLGS
jgi:anti-sigma regulatory factor (Ser/Thr protein kinase)